MAVPRLVATDLDGTLVGSDGRVSAYTQRVLEELERQGVPVVFVTGRPLRWAEDVFEHVGGHGLAVVSNGAVVWDVGADRAVRVRGIPRATCLEACARIRAAVPGTSYAVETLAGFALEAGFQERHPVPRGSPRAPVEELVADQSRGPVLKLLARHEELGYQEFWDRAEAVAGDLLTITWSSTSTLLEMSARDVTKATTLALLCDELGIGAGEVIAFGDMPNDIAMLTWAGTSYAMADAYPTVVAAAGHLAPPYHQDGVARVLVDVFGLDVPAVVE